MRSLMLLFFGSVAFRLDYINQHHFHKLAKWDWEEKLRRDLMDVHRSFAKSGGLER
jgi:hypothetical protein